MQDLEGFDGIHSDLDHSVSIHDFAARTDLSDADAIAKANAISNLLLAHPTCNRAKSVMDTEEFIF